jgi:hypothetical protein
MYYRKPQGHGPTVARSHDKSCRPELEQLEHRTLLSIIGFPADKTILVANYHGTLDSNTGAPAGVIGIDTNWNQSVIADTNASVSFGEPSNVAEDPNSNAILYVTDLSSYGGSVIEVQFQNNAHPTLTVLASESGALGSIQIPELRMPVGVVSIVDGAGHHHLYVADAGDTTYKNNFIDINLSASSYTLVTLNNKTSGEFVAPVGMAPVYNSSGARDISDVYLADEGGGVNTIPATGIIYEVPVGGGNLTTITNGGFLLTDQNHNGQGHTVDVTVDAVTGNLYAANTGYNGTHGSVVKIAYSNHQQTMVYTDDNGFELGYAVDGCVWNPNLGEIITDALENSLDDSGHVCDVTLSGTATQHPNSDLGSGDYLGTPGGMAYYSVNGGDAPLPPLRADAGIMYVGARRVQDGLGELSNLCFQGALVHQPNALPVQILVPNMPPAGDAQHNHSPVPGAETRAGIGEPAVDALFARPVRDTLQETVSR